MNYIEFHLGDYAAATAHLSWDEDMAYMRLLRAYYSSEAPIPADIKQACRLARATTPAQRAAVETVLQEFFDLRADGWHQKRCDTEIERAADKKEKAKRSAAARWDAKPSNSKRNANASQNAMRAHTEGNAPNPNPNPNPKEEPRGSSEKHSPPGKPASVLRSPDLVADGVDAQAAADWLTLRKAKRLPLTPTAWRETKVEAGRAGMTPGEAVAVAVSNNWAGFKAAWLTPAVPSSGGLRSQRVVGAMSEHGLQTMRNAQALEQRLFGDVEVSDAA
ncbi:MAG TPA: YdaU family protein [Burkholderiaceae bacterium]|nr:YdaU family protein [Burkholderiaceae bacterium]